MRTPKHINLLLAALFIFTPMAAWAQDENDEQLSDQLPITTQLTEALITSAFYYGIFLGATVVAGISTTTGGPILTIMLTHNELATLDHYINAHHHQLEQDIALGAGSTLDDLAQLYAIPNEHYRDFSLAIRQHRRQLTIIDPQDPAQIEQFGLAVLSIKYRLAGVHITTQRRTTQ